MPGRVASSESVNESLRDNLRIECSRSANNDNVGDYSWNGAYGTIFFVDPKEQMVVVMMGVAPGEIRKVHREKLNALIYGALEK